MSLITNLDSLSIGQNGQDVQTISSSGLSVNRVSTPIGAATAATNITALPSAKSFYMIATTVAVNIKGILAGTDGQELEVYFKAGGANTLTITPQSTAVSTVANRIVIMTTASTLVTTASGYASFRYNSTDSRWLCRYLST